MLRKNEPDEEGRPKGLFATLFGTHKNSEEDSVGGDDGLPEEVKPEEPVVIDSYFDIGPETALYQLWRRWNAAAPPPRLSIGTEEEGVLLTGRALEQEKSRVRDTLEREAKKRLAAYLALPVPKPPEEGEPELEQPSLPAQCVTCVSSDWMTAWGFLFPPLAGGADPSLEELGKAMGASHITAGIDSEAVTSMFISKDYFKLRLIARGTPVTEGEDGSIEERYPRQRPQGVQVDELGQVDYRSQSYVQVVQKGEVICDIIPPVPGTDGVRVDGKAIQPRGVKPAKVPKGSNTTISEDGAQLIATMDGHLEYSGSAFQIKPMLEVGNNVDYSTGNIDFRGDVHIRGDIRENFSVRATGTVTVDGLVEAATVEAGGDIVIAKGVLGDNKALLKAKGSVRARYLESCVVYSGDCTYADCIMACQIFSDNAISVTTGRGTVIGGGLTAACRVEAKIIGSKSGRETEITLGALPYVQEEKRNNEIDLEAIKEELAELERQLNYLEAKQGIAGSSGQIAKGRLRKSVLAMKVDKLARRQEELEEMTSDLSQCRLECGTVYPVTKLTIGSSVRNIEQMWTKCTAVYDVREHEIIFL